MLGPSGRAGAEGGLSMLVLDQVTAGYHRRSLRAGRERTTVVHEVDLRVEAGEIVALVGESGCGKSTLARTVVGLHRPFSGQVRLDGADVHRLRAGERRTFRREVQMIFEDPFLSLSPRLPVGRAVAEPLEIHRVGSRASRRCRVAELLELVGLGNDLTDRLPRDLSGGQRQRVAIARALAVEPRLLICDEPVTALDVSVQAKVLNLLRDLCESLGLACLFIAHDLAVVCQLADRVAVMYLGRIIEQAPTTLLTGHPRHTYTQALLAAVPRLAAGRPVPPPLPGEPAAPGTGLTGCAFQPRCARREPRCLRERPQLDPISPQHLVACHVPAPARMPATPSRRAP